MKSIFLLKEWFSIEINLEKNYQKFNQDLYLENKNISIEDKLFKDNNNVVNMQQQKKIVIT